MKFKVTKTSEGYLGQGYGEFTAIISEEKTPAKLKESLRQCLLGYLEAFPDCIELEMEEKDKPKKKTKLTFEKETIPQKEDWLGNEIIYWFEDKQDIFDFVDYVAENNEDTVGKVRFGGNFIDIDPQGFRKFINWVYDDCDRIGIAGYDSRDDPIIDVIYLDLTHEDDAKPVKHKCHVSRADEVSMDDRGYVRAWWD